jgi:hypothetical protein
MTITVKKYDCKSTKSNIVLDEIASTFWTADEYLLIANSDTAVALGGIQNKELKANYVGISATAIFRKSVGLPSLAMINRQQLSI